ncbi:MAG TPA: LPXTG cell wall anchor domain-containing protein [Acidimicrobiia bacterium]|nr:LPXTG cell wall anchor domain-containing protein [Acidimicrobiia bacterium]
MNRIRIGLVGLVVLALTGLTAGGATAATGRGTANSSITLLDVKLGDVQQIKVLTNDSQGTLDAARLGLAGNRAFGQLVAVDAIGALNLALPNPAFRAEAPGTSNASLNPIPVSFPPAAVNASTGLPVGAGTLASGSIDPVKIDAFLDSAGARSAVGTDIPNLSVLQGLLSVNNVKVASLSSDASPNSSKADTGVVTVGDVSVLDLDAFLGGLGLSLDDLGLGAVTGLIDGLGLPVSTGSLGLGDLNGAGVSEILGTVFDLTNAINVVVPSAVDCAALSGVTSLLPDVDSLLGTGGLLDGLGLPVLGGSVTGLLSGCNAGNLDATKTSILGQLQSTLTGLAPTADGVLDSVFSTLSGAPLLQVSGIELSALAHAAETLAGSSATTSAKLGTLKVGGLSLGTLDLDATAAQIAERVNSVESTLNSVTSVLGLSNLIDVGILERTSSTKTEGSYTVAQAGVNVLRVSINPPAALSSVLNTAGVLTNPLSGIMGAIGTTLPTAGLADNTLASAFGLTTLLSRPTTVVLGAILAQGDFTTAAPASVTGGGPVSPPVSGELPRTGSNNGAWMAALAALSLAGAFGITRSLRKAQPVDLDG